MNDINMWNEIIKVENIISSLEQQERYLKKEINEVKASMSIYRKVHKTLFNKFRKTYLEKES